MARLPPASRLSAPELRGVRRQALYVERGGRSVLSGAIGRGGAQWTRDGGGLVRTSRVVVLSTPYRIHSATRSRHLCRLARLPVVWRRPRPAAWPAGRRRPGREWRPGPACHQVAGIVRMFGSAVKARAERGARRLCPGSAQRCMPPPTIRRPERTCAGKAAFGLVPTPGQLARSLLPHARPRGRTEDLPDGLL